jgi:hypothetical protein
MGWATATPFKGEAFIAKNSALSLFLENAGAGLKLNPAQDTKYAEAHMSFDNLNFEYIIVSVGWLKLFDILGFY